MLITQYTNINTKEEVNSRVIFKDEDWKSKKYDLPKNVEMLFFREVYYCKLFNSY